jgi:hypothetical protein
MDVVFLHARGGVDEVVERHRHRLAVAAETLAPNRKSFQILVNCQMTQTRMIGPETAA